LHELALEDDRYCQQIVQILCSHIRSKTNEEAYQETHKERPSNEIQIGFGLVRLGFLSVRKKESSL
jgi:hypothetical protein